MRNIIIAAGIVAAILATALVSYRSGFNQGADVALCLVSTFQKERPSEGLDMTSPSCQSAKHGENNPLWIFRPRQQENSDGR
jgi:hypothetical protein